ncbi:hypothetical protein C496_09126 [Natronorubrum tibetense GA33]|uniref:Uncharacterized protein n=2 Tax=Natronorubrum tibetense TaxID=63128 RepID=L9VWZ1_9EURY|nr:hypothetical protein C496_09126 [Natronorubrum tibetense GA33]
MIDDGVRRSRSAVRRIRSRRSGGPIQDGLANSVRLSYQWYAFTCRHRNSGMNRYRSVGASIDRHGALGRRSAPGYRRDGRSDERVDRLEGSRRRIEQVVAR